jgi:hypothetical protein
VPEVCSRREKLAVTLRFRGSFRLGEQVGEVGSGAAVLREKEDGMRWKRLSELVDVGVESWTRAGTSRE